MAKRKEQKKENIFVQPVQKKKTKSLKEEDRDELYEKYIVKEKQPIPKYP